MGTRLALEEMKQFVRDHFEDFVNKRNATVIVGTVIPRSAVRLGAASRNVVRV